MKNKILICIMVLIIILECIIPSYSSAYEIDSAQIVKIGSADYHLKYYNDTKNMATYVICSIVGYYNNGKFFPAYCLNSELPGAETQEYSVNINEIIGREDIWRVVTNGYPYKSAQEMGVNNDYDAFVVTKMAVYCMLGTSQIEKFSYNENDSEAHRMYDALVKLVNIGRNESIKRNAGTFLIEKNGDLVQNDNYYEQEYKVESNVNMNSFEITDLSGFPDGTQVVNMENNPQNAYKKGENFKVLIPISGFDKDINGSFKVSSNLETYPVFYGEAPSGWQNYVVTYDTYEKEKKEVNLNINTNTGSIKVKKIDKELQIPLEGVEFELSKENSDEKTILSTDKNGEIVFSNLYQGKYFLKEIKTGESYILDETPFELNVEYNKETFLQVGNEVKKGKLKIIKTDKDSKEPIEGVEFEIIDRQTGEIVDVISTNENGEALIDLRIDRQYALKELYKNEKYFVNDQEYHFNVYEDTVTELNIENEKKPEFPEEPKETPEEPVKPDKPEEPIEPDLPEEPNEPKDPLEVELIEEEIPQEKIILPKLKKLPKTGM